MGKRLSAFVLVTLLLLCASLAQEKTPFAFKNDRLGMSRAEWMNVHGYADTGGAKEICKAATREAPLQKCITFAPEETIGGCAVAYTVYMFFNDRLATVYISVPERCFKDVEQELRAKFGNSKNVQQQVMKTAAGAERQGRVDTWSNGLSDLDLTQFEDDTETSSVLFTHNSLAAEAAAFIKNRNRK